MIYIVYDKDGSMQGCFRKEHNAKAKANGIGGYYEGYCIHD